MTQDIPARVQKIVADMAPVGGDVVVGADTLLVEDLGYHSLALLELAIHLEVELGLPAMEAGSAGSIRTVADITNMVVTALSGSAAIDVAGVDENSGVTVEASGGSK